MLWILFVVVIFFFFVMRSECREGLFCLIELVIKFLCIWCLVIVDDDIEVWLIGLLLLLLLDGVLSKVLMLEIFY